MRPDSWESTAYENCKVNTAIQLNLKKCAAIVVGLWAIIILHLKEKSFLDCVISTMGHKELEKEQETQQKWLTTAHLKHWKHLKCRTKGIHTHTQTLYMPLVDSKCDQWINVPFNALCHSTPTRCIHHFPDFSKHVMCENLSKCTGHCFGKKKKKWRDFFIWVLFAVRIVPIMIFFFLWAKWPICSYSFHRKCGAASLLRCGP